MVVEMGRETGTGKGKGNKGGRYPITLISEKEFFVMRYE